MSDWIKTAFPAELARIKRLSYVELCAEAKTRGEDPAEVIAALDFMRRCEWTSTRIIGRARNRAARAMRLQGDGDR